MNYDVITPLLERLALIPEAVTVEEAWFAEPLERFDEQTPALMPYLAEERATGEPQTLRPVQQVTLVYGLWIVCRREDFRPLRQSVSDVLFGHQFGEQHNPAAYLGGKVHNIVGDLIWWQESWAIETHRRGQPQ